MILKLNKEIYPRKTIQKSIGLYKKIVNLTLKEEKKYFLVSGKIEKENEELVKNEFLNYILSIIRQ
ncbi:MAG: HxsD-like protein [Spirochaetes bacterium]|nr:HxsD-like protein [Spirochaetota bacterium]